MFLPCTREEMARLGWETLDVILVTGDAYIDSPFIGVAVIGKILVAHGFRVGVIAQPDLKSNHDIARLGEPLLFWGITGGSIDSMVANRTASNRRRKTDDYTPGGENTRRPDRAVIAYANLIRQHCKHTAPLVLGGIEASLRRLAHYDAWDNRVRRSILFDAKADYLLYGMADRGVIELARAHVCVGGTLLTEAEQPGGPTVHALLIAGRTDAQKAALIAGLTRVIEETLQVPAAPVRIMILDVPNTDFGLGGLTALARGR